MNSEAEMTLQYVAAQLDSSTPPLALEPCSDCSALIAADSPPQEDVDKHYALHLLGSSLDSAKLTSLQTILIGSNVLTPSLVSRGWKIWRTPPLTPSESAAVKAASLRCSDTVSEAAIRFTDAIGSSDDQLKIVQLMSKSQREVSGAMAQLSGDLKRLM